MICYESHFQPSFFQNKTMAVYTVNTLKPRQDGRHFPNDIFKNIFVNENVKISIKISLKFVPKGPINKIPALVKIMAWRRPGDKPLPQPMMISLLTYICITLPQWVNAQVQHPSGDARASTETIMDLSRGPFLERIFHPNSYSLQNCF